MGFGMVDGSTILRMFLGYQFFDFLQSGVVLCTFCEREVVGATRLVSFIIDVGKLIGYEYERLCVIEQLC